ncbi:TPA: hypothetical protein ACGIK9_003304 [Acinetobacter baumannii]|uniref:hypothetical protein n=1 Tax=Acinetobacter baumannii TaxID=470 RepID=UPI00338D8DD4
MASLSYKNQDFDLRGGTLKAQLSTGIIAGYGGSVTTYLTCRRIVQNGDSREYVLNDRSDFRQTVLDSSCSAYTLEILAQHDRLHEEFEDMFLEKIINHYAPKNDLVLDIGNSELILTGACNTHDNLPLSLVNVYQDGDVLNIDVVARILSNKTGHWADLKATVEICPKNFANQGMFTQELLHKIQHDLIDQNKDICSDYEISTFNYWVNSPNKYLPYGRVTTDEESSIGSFALDRSTYTTALYCSQLLSDWYLANI